MFHALNSCYLPSKVKLRGDKVHDTFDFDDFLFCLATKAILSVLNIIFFILKVLSELTQGKNYRNYFQKRDVKHNLITIPMLRSLRVRSASLYKLN